jgi:hypothetical protein
MTSTRKRITGFKLLEISEMSVHWCRLSTERCRRLISVPVYTFGILGPWPRTETSAAVPLFLFNFSPWRMSKPFLRVAQSTENSVTTPVRKTGGATSCYLLQTHLFCGITFCFRFVGCCDVVIECLAVHCNTRSVKYIMRDIRPFLVSSLCCKKCALNIAKAANWIVYCACGTVWELMPT